MDKSKRHVVIVLLIATVLGVSLVYNRWKTPVGVVAAPKDMEIMPKINRKEVGRAEFIGAVFKDVKPPVWVGSILVKDPANVPVDSLQAIVTWSREAGLTALEVYAMGELAWKDPKEARITEAARNMIFTAAQTEESNPVVSDYLFQQGKRFLDKGMEMNPRNVPLRNALIIYLSIYETGTMKFLPVLRETEEIDSNNVETHYIHLGLTKKSGQWKKAIEECQKLISLQPQNSAWLFEASDLYGNQGDSTNARIYLDLAKRARKKELK